MAACSKTTEPADVMKIFFLIIYQFLFCYKFRYSATDDSVARPTWMNTVEQLLVPMPAASKRVFLNKFSHHLPNITGTAYTPAICAAGFAIPGIYS